MSGVSKLAMSKNFVPVPYDSQFIAYASGYAKQIQANLENHIQVEESQVRWLEQATGTVHNTRSIVSMCRQLIDAYTVLMVTEKLTQ
jgi:hypothetical protein